MQSCLSLVPQPPRKDYIKMLDNDHKNLRFEAILVSSISTKSFRSLPISGRFLTVFFSALSVLVPLFAVFLRVLSY